MFFVPRSGCVARSVDVWLRELASCRSVGLSVPVGRSRSVGPGRSVPVGRSGRSVGPDWSVGRS